MDDFTTWNRKRLARVRTRANAIRQFLRVARTGAHDDIVAGIEELCRLLNEENINEMAQAVIAVVEGARRQ